MVERVVAMVKDHANLFGGVSNDISFLGFAVLDLLANRLEAREGVSTQQPCPIIRDRLFGDDVTPRTTMGVSTVALFTMSWRKESSRQKEWFFPCPLSCWIGSMITEQLYSRIRGR